MKIQRMDLKELEIGKTMEMVAGTKIFIPSRTKMDEPPPPPPPPVFSEADMKNSEREGYKKGFAAGELEGCKKTENEQAEVNRKLTGMLDQFVKSVSPVFEHYSKMVLQVQKDLPHVAAAVARKVAGAALEEHADKVIADIAMRCCESMISEPELTIIAHESMADTLENKLQEMAARLPAATRIVILRDPDMPLADCRIEWQKGAMERVTEQLWRNIDKVVSNMSAMATSKATVEIEAVKTAIAQTNETPPNTKE